MRVRKIEKSAEYHRFSFAFEMVSGHKIPVEYLNGENVWVLEDYFGNFVGGFALIENKVPRSILQIPTASIRSRYQYVCNELTCYFIQKKEGSFLLTMRLLKESLKANKKLFCYSYKFNDRKLRSYYRAGNPTVIYIGRPLKLEGHDSSAVTESVELLTKWGILKIFLTRTFKHCRKVLWRRNDFKICR